MKSFLKSVSMLLMLLASSLAFATDPLVVVWAGDINAVDDQTNTVAVPSGVTYLKSIEAGTPATATQMEQGVAAFVAAAQADYSDIVVVKYAVSNKIINKWADEGGLATEYYYPMEAAVLSVLPSTYDMVLVWVHGEKDVTDNQVSINGYKSDLAWIAEQLREETGVTVPVIVSRTKTNSADGLSKVRDGQKRFVDEDYTINSSNCLDFHSALLDTDGYARASDGKTLTAAGQASLGAAAYSAAEALLQ